MVLARAGRSLRGRARRHGMIRLPKHDLLRDEYPSGPFDLVACRNVVIYFTEEAKEDDLPGLRRRAAPGGILFVGGTEAIMRPQSAWLEGRRPRLLPQGARGSELSVAATDAPLPESPEQMVSSAPELEALPVVAQRCWPIVRDERTTLDSIAELLGTDQALASAVLRYANSARAMPNRRIASLREAVARIGQRALSEVLVRACAGPMLDRGLPPYALPRRVAWRHAATASIAARDLADLLQDAACRGSRASPGCCTTSARWC